mmetsp:Transcript_67124/g.151705  ORF Transcript_67124/g.151705 Transcript_67124/m.151705 type:complete len:298 (-) Transcript_67124:1445-2338(-)
MLPPVPLAVVVSEQHVQDQNHRGAQNEGQGGIHKCRALCARTLCAGPAIPGKSVLALCARHALQVLAAGTARLASDALTVQGATVDAEWTLHRGPVVGLQRGFDGAAGSRRLAAEVADHAHWTWRANYGGHAGHVTHSDCLWWARTVCRKSCCLDAGCGCTGTRVTFGCCLPVRKFSYLTTRACNAANAIVVRSQRAWVACRLALGSCKPPSCASRACHCTISCRQRGCVGRVRPHLTGRTRISTPWRRTATGTANAHPSLHVWRRARQAGCQDRKGKIAFHWRTRGRTHPVRVLRQ